MPPVTDTGVLVVGFGGPLSLDDVGPFMTELMGREPSPELLERIKRRYLTIGGRSPLPETARSIAEELEQKLSSEDGIVPVRSGMRYWHPYIHEALSELAGLGVKRVVTVTLSPFETQVASGEYRKAIEKAAEGLPHLELVEAPAYRDSRSFLTILTVELGEARDRAKKHGRYLTLFTAHSLPVDEAGDDYVAQLRSTVDQIVARSGMPEGAEDTEVLPGISAYGSADEHDPWMLAFQSKGARGGEWLGPDVDDVVDAAAEAGYVALAVSPFAFVTDHMETLYDLDVVLAGKALDLDMEFERAGVPNDSPSMLEVLAEVVRPLL